MATRTPRPRVVCPSCSQIHEQTGSTAVCGACLRRERTDAEREQRQRVNGSRCGTSARGDFDAVFRDPRSPFSRAFRQAFFRQDPLRHDGMDRFVERLRELYADQIDTANERARRRYEEGYAAGHAAAVLQGQADAVEAAGGRR